VTPPRNDPAEPPASTEVPVWRRALPLAAGTELTRAELTNNMTTLEVWERIAGP